MLKENFIDLDSNVKSGDRFFSGKFKKNNLSTGVLKLK